MVGDVSRLDVKEDVMKRIGTTLAALGLCVAVAACQNPQQKIANKEDMMTAAGFKFVPANTPAAAGSRSSSCRRTSSRAQIRDGRVFYVYPDPTVCVCLYVGDQNAYATIARTCSTSSSPTSSR